MVTQLMLEKLENDDLRNLVEAQQVHSICALPVSWHVRAPGSPYGLGQIPLILSLQFQIILKRL